MNHFSNGSLPSGYRLRQGAMLDRAILLKFMHRTYAELQPLNSFEHLSATVDQYLAQETPFWWIETDTQRDQTHSSQSPDNSDHPVKVGCIWLGTAIDQPTGDRHTHIFLLYVAPSHRRRGLGTALLHHAETWAKARGDRKIGLQVFQTNQLAVQLYTSLGYHPQAVWMSKELEPGPCGGK